MILIKKTAFDAEASGKPTEKGEPEFRLRRSGFQ
jgi:hypothetical protein